MNERDEYIEHLRRIIAEIQRRHAQELEPWFQKLVEADALRTGHTFTVTVEQARAMGLLQGIEQPGRTVTIAPAVLDEAPAGSPDKD